tara:strand:+ start:5193 stop:6065 length:873 start_codon:yes stop_codon:yes gene_type:complete
MYESHFNLIVKPFSLSPDPKFLYLGKRHSQAYAMLEYSIKEHVGFAVVTGEVGAGKTTLIRKLLTEFDDADNVALVSHTHQNLTKLIPCVLDAFCILADEIPEDESKQYRFFVDFLITQYTKGRRSILIIDEAQNLCIEALEQLRLLSNVNVDGHLLLQTLLIGQPELRDKLRRPELHQFAQRISVDFFLPKLSQNESIEYIDHRLMVAGGEACIFETNAKVIIAHAAKGLPRMINNLCDMALVYAFGDSKCIVDIDVVLDVLKDKEETGIFPLASISELDGMFEKIACN